MNFILSHKEKNVYFMEDMDKIKILKVQSFLEVYTKFLLYRLPKTCSFNASKFDLFWPFLGGIVHICFLSSLIIRITATTCFVQRL